MPTIKSTETEHKIPSNSLNMSPNSSNSFTIFSSAKGSIIAEEILYIIVNIASFIIGAMHIPIIIITPTTPRAFFNTSPHPKTLSTESPNIFPYHRNHT